MATNTPRCAQTPRTRREQPNGATTGCATRCPLWRNARRRRRTASPGRTCAAGTALLCSRPGARAGAHRRPATGGYTGGPRRPTRPEVPHAAALGGRRRPLWRDAALTPGRRRIAGRAHRPLCGWPTALNAPRGRAGERPAALRRESRSVVCVDMCRRLARLEGRIRPAQAPTRPMGARGELSGGLTEYGSAPVGERARPRDEDGALCLPDGTRLDGFLADVTSAAPRAACRVRQPPVLETAASANDPPGLTVRRVSRCHPYRRVPKSCEEKVHARTEDAQRSQERKAT